MKKGTRITLICILSILILAIVGLTIFGYVQRFAYADYIDVVSNPNAIVNFNQYFLDTFTHNYSLGRGANYPTNFVIEENHIYYVRIDVSFETEGHCSLEYAIANNDYTNILDFYNTGVYDSVFTANKNNARIDIYTRIEGVYLNYGLLVDLTQMFGSDSIPNVSQCRDLFTSDYYSYNTGFPMNANGLSSYSLGYSNGVQSVYDSLYYEMNTDKIKSVVQPYNIRLDEYHGIISSVDINPDIPDYPDHNIITFKGAIYIPFLTSAQGASIDVEFMFYYTMVASTKFKYRAYLVYENNDIELVDTNYDNFGYSASDIQFYLTTRTYYTNKNVIGLVIENDLYNGSTPIYDLKIKFRTNDISTLITKAIDQNTEKLNSYYNNLYSENGEGYNKIFNLGKQYAMQHNANNAWGSAWDFIESTFTGIGSIFAIEFMPGVPLSVFILVPLMLGLIFFVVKLTKGGGD